jgi:hypothetical protein
MREGQIQLQTGIDRGGNVKGIRFEPMGQTKSRRLMAVEDCFDEIGAEECKGDNAGRVAAFLSFRGSEGFKRGRLSTGNQLSSFVRAGDRLDQRVVGARRGNGRARRIDQRRASAAEAGAEGQDRRQNIIVILKLLAGGEPRANGGHEACIAEGLAGLPLFQALEHGSPVHRDGDGCRLDGDPVRRSTPRISARTSVPRTCRRFSTPTIKSSTGAAGTRVIPARLVSPLGRDRLA